MSRQNPQAEPAMRVLVLFEIGEHRCALPVESVKEIVLMAKLSTQPGMPSLLDGYLNLRGEALPVFRLARRLGLSEREPGLYTPILVTRAGSELVGIVVDRVQRVLSVPLEGAVPPTEALPFAEAVETDVTHEDEPVHVLAAERLYRPVVADAGAGGTGMREAS